MVVRHRHSLRVEVEHSWAEAADYEVVPVEGLVDRRGHVELACDWGEVVDAERPWEAVAVPAHDVERVETVRVFRHALARLDYHMKLALFVMGAKLARGPDVALVVRRMLFKLAEVVSVSLRDFDWAVRFDREHLCGKAVELNPVDRPAWDHEIVAGRERDVAKHRLERAAAGVHKQQLIALGVLVKIRHLLGDVRLIPEHVVVAHQALSPADRIAARLHQAGL